MISVIIPAYNAEKYIFECLESIRNQTFEDFEVIVVDDGSSDDTASIAESFSACDSRFKVIKQKNLYAGIARNNGMSIAVGDHLLFFDADDVMLPTMLELMHSKAVEVDADIVICCSCDFKDESPDKTQSQRTPKYVEFDRVYSGMELGDNAFRCTVGWPWDKLIKTSHVKNYGLEFQDLPATNDAYFVFTAMALAKRIAFVDSVLVHHRKRQGSIETARLDNPENTLQARDAIRSKLASEGCLEIFERAIANWSIAHLRWDFRTLPGDMGQKTFIAYQELLRSVADKGIDYPMEEPDRHVQKAFELAARTSLEYSFVNEALEAHKWSKAASAKEARIKRLLSRVKKLEARCSELEKKIEAEQQKNQQLRDSSSYKVGRALTAIPRRMSKKESDE